MINPADAADRGIEADSVVTVTSRAGQVQLPVVLTEDMMPGVVCMPHLWGHNRKNTRQLKYKRYQNNTRHATYLFFASPV